MFSIIVATSENNIIGDNNKLLWHIPDDLKRFKNITSGHKIVMGRKTFDSLPGVLPNRKHIVFSKNTELNSFSNSVEFCSNLDKFIADNLDSNEEIFIIGGGEIYKFFMPFCTKIYLTKVYKTFNGDTTFPTINFDDWKTSLISEKKTNPKDNLKYQFIDLIK